MPSSKLVHRRQQTKQLLGQSVGARGGCVGSGCVYTAGVWTVHLVVSSLQSVAYNAGRACEPAVVVPHTNRLIPCIVLEAITTGRASEE